MKKERERRGKLEITTEREEERERDKRRGLEREEQNILHCNEFTSLGGPSDRLRRPT